MNYYNEWDKKAAAWLRELIKAGVIPPGDVDERSITEVRATDLVGYTQCHWFAGIAGWSHALKLANWSPDRSIWTGSCPCQPFSAAGKQLGEEDERHLWPEFYRIIREYVEEVGDIPVITGEQVASKAGRQWLSGVRTDLEALGRTFGASDLCSAGVGAPNLRQRLYWMAYSESFRWYGGKDDGDEGRGKCASGSGSETRRLAEPNGRDTGSEREQRSGEQRLISEDGGAGGMEHSEGDRCEMWEHVHGQLPRQGSGEGRDVSRVADTEHTKRGRELEASGAGSGRSGPRGSGGLVNSIEPRLEGLGGDGNGGDGNGGDKSRRIIAQTHGSASEASSIGRMADSYRQHGNRAGHGSGDDGRELEGPEKLQGFWDNYDLIPCTDGKARRVEPGTFPLAHGIPGRVGLLRGYGNGINPVLAAEFIQACEEARRLVEIEGTL